MRRPVPHTCLLIILSTAALHASELDSEKQNNWHQWRGPFATGVAPNANPPAEWSTTKNVKWKVAIPGRGSASPIVWGDKIFILTAVKTDRTEPAATDASGSSADRRGVSEPSGVPPSANRVFGQVRQEPPADRQLRTGSGPEGPRRFGGGRFNIQAPTTYYEFNVLCIDRQTGKIIWQRTPCESIPHEGHHDTGSFASSSPITDGRYLYAPFGSRGIYCYDLAGDLRWSKDLGDFRMRFSFGEGASPALYGDTLVQICDQEKDSFIVALNARTGDEIWRQSRDEVSSWSTPLIVEAAGHTQVITSGANRIRSYDLRNGQVIWECGGLGSNPIACPVVHDGLAITMTGHNNPAGVAVPLDAQGDVTSTDKVAWKIEGTTSYVASPVLYDGILYFPKSRNAILSSVDAKTGQYLISQQRLPEMSSIYASPVAARGKIYICSREGVTHVINAAPKLDIRATSDLGDTIDASPAIVGGDLIIRTENHLYCISE